MNTKKILAGLSSLALLALTSCASAPAPSSGAWNMVSPLVGPEQPAPTGELASLGAVNSNFCVENGNLLTRMGMMNEVTKRALALRPGARYLSNAKYQHKGAACIEVSGTAMK